MPLLRLLLAGLVALFALVTVCFTAMLVLFTGMAAWLMQLFRLGRRPAQSRVPRRDPSRGNDEIIDVMATDVSDRSAAAARRDLPGS